MKRTREEFENELILIQQVQSEMKKAITMKGALVSFALLHGKKDIENRSKQIKPGWYALHTGSGKINPEIEKYVIKNLQTIIKQEDIPKEKDLPHSCIVGAFHISGSLELKNDANLKKNGWSLGPVCNFVDKTLSFDNPIPTKGAIALGWNFDSIDKRNDDIRKEKLSERIKKELLAKEKKIKQELKKFL